ncbi:MAG: HEPN domain-containing protein [Snowella sp.]|nr:HEPN domain-containing protein [Snowella sp.]
MQTAYQETAERTLAAAKYLLEREIYEMAGFCCYHAYESSASALAINCSRPHGKDVPNHRRKLDIFQECVNSIGDSPILAKVRQLNLRIKPVRDNFLYPTENADGQIMLPRNYLSREQIERLFSDVQEIVEWVGTQVRA